MGFFLLFFYEQLPLVMPQERPLVEKCKIDVYVTEESEAQE